MDGVSTRTYILLGGLSQKTFNALAQRYKDEYSSADALVVVSEQR